MTTFMGLGAATEEILLATPRTRLSTTNRTVRVRLVTEAAMQSILFRALQGRYARKAVAFSPVRLSVSAAWSFSKTAPGRR